MGKKAHVKLDYHKMSVTDLLQKGTVVQQGIDKNSDVFSYAAVAPIPKPPYTSVAFGGFIKTLVDADAAYDQGGRAQKPAFKAALTELKSVMDEYADYVDIIADGDEGIITLSGFSVADGSAAHQKQTPPATPVAEAERSETSGEIVVQTTVYSRGTSYSCLVSEGGPLNSGTTMSPTGQLFIPAGNTNRIIHAVDIQRVKKIMGLTKGVNYWVYFYVANSAGVSQLSTGIEILCG